MSVANATSRRRWFQFSVLSLFAVMTGVAILFALVVVPAWRQRDAVAAILDLGGRVTYDYQESGATTPPAPSWVRMLVGDDCFQTAKGAELVGAVFDNAQKIDAVLLELARLPELVSVLVSAKGLMDDHLRAVGKLSSLRALTVSGPNVTDVGLAHVGRMANLQQLDVIAPISDAGLANLAGMTQLRSLEILGPVTDAGMKHLEPLAQLERLKCAELSSPRELYQGQTFFGFENVSLADAIDHLAKHYRFKYRFDDAALDAAGISLERLEITDEATVPSLAQALDRILTPVGLGFRVEAGQIVVTTRDEAERAHAGINQLRKALPNLRDVQVGW